MMMSSNYGVALRFMVEMMVPVMALKLTAERLTTKAVAAVLAPLISTMAV
jgi:hypothetical protein